MDHRGQRRWRPIQRFCSQPDQSPANTISKTSSTPVSRRTRSRTSSPRRRTSAGRAVLVVDDEVGVLLADDRATDAHALEAQAVDQRRRPIRSPTGCERRCLPTACPSGWCCLAPTADLVEALADHGGLGGLELERRPGDDLRRAGRCVLQDAVAIGQARARRGRASARCRRRARRTPRRGRRECPTHARRRWPTRRRRRSPGWPGRTRAPTDPPVLHERGRACAMADRSRRSGVCPRT